MLDHGSGVYKYNQHQCAVVIYALRFLGAANND